MEKWLYVMFIEKTKTYNRLTKAAVERHVANIRALDEEGRLELCGVFKGYPGVAGMYILRAGSYEEAEELCKREGLKILIAGHSYVVEDPYVGKVVTDYLKAAGVTPLRADLAEREHALKRSRELSPTCKWEISREILGGIDLRKGQVDGIILISAFPCGPDAMVNELITRRVRGVPILNLVLDSQSGTAGVETRLESFIDIIRFKEGKL